MLWGYVVARCTVSCRWQACGCVHPFGSARGWGPGAWDRFACGQRDQSDRRPGRPVAGASKTSDHALPASGPAHAALPVAASWATRRSLGVSAPGPLSTSRRRRPPTAMSSVRGPPGKPPTTTAQTATLPDATGGALRAQQRCHDQPRRRATGVIAPCGGLMYPGDSYRWACVTAVAAGLVARRDYWLVAVAGAGARRGLGAPLRLRRAGRPGRLAGRPRGRRRR